MSSCEPTVAQKQKSNPDLVARATKQSFKPNWNLLLTQLIHSPFEKKLEGTVLKIVVNNQDFFTEPLFDSFLVELALQMAPAAVPFQAMEVQGVGSNDTFFKAKIYFSDVLSFTKGEISKPELARRFQVEVIETLVSLKVKAKKARQEKKWEEAALFLEKWLILEPNSIEALSLLGNDYRDLKKYWEAIRVYQKILSLDAQSVFAFHNLAYTFDKVGDFSGAIAAYQKALEKDPQNPLLVRQLAEVHRKNGDAKETMALLSKARAKLEVDDLWLIEGNLKRDQKKFSEARAAYQKGQKKNPQDGRFFFNLLLIDLDTKSYAEAQKKYGELKGKFPQFAEELEGIEVFREEKEGY